jgi:hypothetical protein
MPLPQQQHNSSSVKNTSQLYMQHRCLRMSAQILFAKYVQQMAAQLQLLQGAMPACSTFNSTQVLLSAAITVS